MCVLCVCRGVSEFKSLQREYKGRQVYLLSFLVVVCFFPKARVSLQIFTHIACLKRNGKGYRCMSSNSFKK